MDNQRIHDIEVRLSRLENTLKEMNNKLLFLYHKMNLTTKTNKYSSNTIPSTRTPIVKP